MEKQQTTPIKNIPPGFTSWKKYLIFLFPTILCSCIDYYTIEYKLTTQHCNTQAWSEQTVKVRAIDSLGLYNDIRISNSQHSSVPVLEYTNEQGRSEEMLNICDFKKVRISSQRKK